MSEQPFDAANRADTDRGLPSTSEASPNKLPFTPEQIAQVNRQYDVVLYLGTHGATEAAFTRRGLKGMAMKDAYYKEAIQVTKSLEADDILFIEGYGHTGEAYRPFSTDIGALGHAAMRTIIEIKRQQQIIDAFRYAYDIAFLEGTPVIFADLSEKHPQTISATELFRLTGYPEGSKEKQKADHITELREEEARNTIIQWGLDHPRDAPATARKPKLKLLFGSEHIKGLRKVFHDAGITVTIINLPQHYLQSLEAEERINHIMSLLD